MTLDEHMAACARQSGLRLGGAGSAFSSLLRTLTDNPVMMAEAKARLAAIDSKVVERDHVSKWRQDLLERVTRA